MVCSGVHFVMCGMWIDVQCEATSSNVIVATASQRSTPSSSGVYIDSMSTGVHHTVAADIKPTVDSTDMAVQQWTPSKILQISPPKPLLSTAAGVKTEVCIACFVKVL